MNSMLVLIMAGGEGTRFWPCSRADCPKQFLNITGSRTLLQETAHRVLSLVGYERIFLVTGRRYYDKVREQLPELEPSHIILEPEMRNTAPCIGLAAIYLRQIAPDETMAVLPADHIITDQKEFLRALSAADLMARKHSSLITFGIVPTYPASGYGYIHRGQIKEAVEGIEVFEVEEFVEKPSQNVAEDYLRSGNYLWNSGMFVWKISTIIGMFERFMPELYRGLEELSPLLSTPAAEDKITQLYSAVAPISIDYAIMEKAPQVLCVKGSFGWDDLGSWSSLGELLPGDEAGNRSQGEFVQRDCRDNIIYSPHKPVAAIGVDNLVVVETDDVLLICHKERAQEVRELIQKLKEEGKKELL
ncbi:mannose-1-phosphate guanylyltransferase [bacterium (candidate division B38) B3_B38]|nr:MAG: mannose-1-phosphate guanylyltransferase [bacterium (candidate division B38) B3_B38]